mmetsp:Transcript_32047/g.44731  ORF Transcript_32047/g.44731 Transcript_32047/m.44731 type:complete len:204 (+) Transcript_32047:116-727(+)
MPFHSGLHTRSYGTLRSTSEILLDQRRPPVEGLSASDDEVSQVHRDENWAVGIGELTNRRKENKEDHQQQGAAHPEHALIDACNILINGLSAVLQLEDDPRQCHGKENILHIRPESIGNRCCRLVLLCHEHRRNSIGKRGANGTNGDPQKAVRERWYVVVDLIGNLQHKKGEDRKPEHGPHKTQRPPTFFSDIFHIHGEERKL